MCKVGHVTGHSDVDSEIKGSVSLREKDSTQTESKQQ